MASLTHTHTAPNHAMPCHPCLALPWRGEASKCAACVWRKVLQLHPHTQRSVVCPLEGLPLPSSLQSLPQPLVPSTEVRSGRPMMVALVDNGLGCKALAAGTEAEGPRAMQRHPAAAALQATTPEGPSWGSTATKTPLASPGHRMGHVRGTCLKGCEPHTVPCISRQQDQAGTQD